MVRWIKDILKKVNIKYRFTVPPQATFHANGVEVTNNTDEVVDIWAEHFPDRRKEPREELPIIKEENING